jgi:hypothetical protein
MRRTLLQQLDHQGWNLVCVQPYRSIRMPGEVWQLESTWSPRGIHAYLLFGTDPFDFGSDSIAIYRQPPETIFIDPGDGWLVRRRWRADLPAIFAELALIRAEIMPESPSSPQPSGPETRVQLLHKLSERRVRLFTCACLRRFWHLVENERNQQAIEAMEKYADAVIRKRDMKKARKAACILWLTSFDAYEEAVITLQAAAQVMTIQQQMVLDDLLADIAGNLGQRELLRPSWLRRNDGIVPRIAQAIYADQSFFDLPILADALEEAGCDNAVILNHCRQPGEHARGCWVLDLLLGKS